MRRKTNPNGANQYLVDPRQALFLGYYLNPKSETFSNGYQSALKAGFEDEYAKGLFSKMPKWLAENVKSMTMVNKAERNLDQMLDLETKQEVITKDGPLVDEGGSAPVTNNFTQIIINPPNGVKDARNQSDAEAVPRVASITES